MPLPSLSQVDKPEASLDGVLLGTASAQANAVCAAREDTPSAEESGESYKLVAQFRNAGVASVFKELWKRRCRTSVYGSTAAGAVVDMEDGAGLLVMGGATTTMHNPILRAPVELGKAGSVKQELAEAQPAAFPAPQGADGSPDRPVEAGELYNNKVQGFCCLPWATSCWRPLTEHAKVTCDIVRRYPKTLAVPMLVFALLVGLGVYGVVAAGQSHINHEKSVARSIARDAAVGFEAQMAETYTPVATMQILIQENPSWKYWAARYQSIAERVMSRVDTSSLWNMQIQPFGVVRFICPMRPEDYGQIGRDLLADPTRRSLAMDIIHSGKDGINGPFNLQNGFTGAFLRSPIYIANVSANETFEYSFKNMSGWPAGRSACPDGLCYNPETHTAWWGFISILVNYDNATKGSDSRLAALKEKGYHYVLLAPNGTQQPIDSASVIAEVGGPINKHDAVSVDVNVPEGVWRLYVEPASGWGPAWEAPLIISVIIISLIISILLFVAARLLHTTMDANRNLAETTKKLGEEKNRMDALLVRQYRLLACLGGGHGRGNNQGKTGGSVKEGGGEYESSSIVRSGITIERIEDMRRLVNAAASTLLDKEQIQIMEVLGEGAFGKVHKGLWRGTVVAVKTMILPANMTGAEKRERMAVMEAAISSSLVHPNIVTTYTYSIRPYKEGGNTSDTHCSNFDGPNTLLEDGSAHGSSVHSYEVRLVLEYCDKGSLREALNNNVFLTKTGINYAAMLDTAADVAKAMVHMHGASILHSDLKARNIMLKSTGTEGRGVTAKVADFGLSTRMDHMETHVSSMFQGTLTHMAPEVMMEGRISKAADVYAFGIMMWELFCGAAPFSDVPRAHLGHAITKQGLRPTFPPFAPAAYVDLAQRCWHADPGKRPCFEEVLAQLLRMREEVGGETEMLHVPLPKPPQPKPSRISLKLTNSGSHSAGGGSGSGSMMGRPRGSGRSHSRLGMTQQGLATLGIVVGGATSFAGASVSPVLAPVDEHSAEGQLYEDANKASSEDTAGQQQQQQPQVKAQATLATAPGPAASIPTTKALAEGQAYAQRSAGGAGATYASSCYV